MHRQQFYKYQLMSSKKPTFQPFTRICCNATNSAAIQKDEGQNAGKLYVWGSAKFGLLGTENLTRHTQHPEELDIEVPEKYRQTIQPTEEEAKKDNQIDKKLNQLQVFEISMGVQHIVALCRHPEKFSDNRKDMETLLFSWGKADERLGRNLTLKDQADQSQTKTQNKEREFLGPEWIKEFHEKPKANISPEGVYFLKIACGRDSTLALSNKENLYTWGFGQTGTLGQGKDHDKITCPTKIKVIKQQAGDLRKKNDYHSNQDEVKFVQIAAGTDHCLALDIEGQVWSWGSGQGGRLGHGDHTSLSEPKMIQKLKKPVVKIFCGAHSSAAIRYEKNGDSQVYIWGVGLYGRLGLGNNEAMSVPTIISDFSQNDKMEVESLALGMTSSFAIMKPGSEQKLFCWGSGQYGKLGMQFYSDKCQTTPKYLAKFQEGKEPIEVAAGSFHTLTLTKSGELYAFGSAGEGKLGVRHPAARDNSSNNQLKSLTFIQQDVPQLVEIKDGDNYKPFKLFQNFSDNFNQKRELNQAFQIFEQDRFILKYEKLEEDFKHFNKRNITKQMEPWQIIQVVCTNVNSFLLCADGTIYASGDNEFYQCTEQNKKNLESQLQTDKRKKSDLDTLNIIPQVALEIIQQIGKKKTEFVQIPIVINLNKIKFIAAGEGGHVVAIDQHNKCYSWGNNSHGQLGRSSSNNDGKDDFCKEPDKINDLINTKIKMVACGHSFTLFLDIDGKIHSCGDNSFGQLGFKQIQDQKSESQQHKAPKVITSGKEDFKDVLFIAAGDYHSVCIKQIQSEGSMGNQIQYEYKLFSWGWNGFGQLGRSNHKTAFTLHSPQQVQIEGQSSNFAMVSAGVGHTLAIDDRKRLWFCGDREAIGSTKNLEQRNQEEMIQLSSKDQTIDTENFIFVSACNENNYAINSQHKVYSFGQVQTKSIEQRNKYLGETRNLIEYKEPISLVNYKGKDISCQEEFFRGSIDPMSQFSHKKYTTKRIKANTLQVDFDTVPDLQARMISAGATHQIAVSSKVEIPKEVQEQLQKHENSGSIFFQQEYILQYAPYIWGNANRGRCGIDLLEDKNMNIIKNMRKVPIKTTTKYEKKSEEERNIQLTPILIPRPFREEIDKAVESFFDDINAQQLQEEAKEEEVDTPFVNKTLESPFTQSTSHWQQINTQKEETSRVVQDQLTIQKLQENFKQQKKHATELSTQKLQTKDKELIEAFHQECAKYSAKLYDCQKVQNEQIFQAQNAIISRLKKFPVRFNQLNQAEDIKTIKDQSVMINNWLECRQPKIEKILNVVQLHPCYLITWLKYHLKNDIAAKIKNPEHQDRLTMSLIKEMISIVYGRNVKDNMRLILQIAVIFTKFLKYLKETKKFSQGPNQEESKQDKLARQQWDMFTNTNKANSEEHVCFMNFQEWLFSLESQNEFFVNTIATRLIRDFMEDLHKQDRDYQIKNKLKKVASFLGGKKGQEIVPLKAMNGREIFPKILQLINEKIKQDIYSQNQKYAYQPLNTADNSHHQVSSLSVVWIGHLTYVRRMQMQCREKQTTVEVAQRRYRRLIILFLVEQIYKKIIDSIQVDVKPDNSHEYSFKNSAIFDTFMRTEQPKDRQGIFMQQESDNPVDEKLSRKIKLLYDQFQPSNTEAQDSSFLGILQQLKNFELEDQKGQKTSLPNSKGSNFMLTMNAVSKSAKEGNFGNIQGNKNFFKSQEELDDIVKENNFCLDKPTGNHPLHIETELINQCIVNSSFETDPVLTITFDQIKFLVNELFKTFTSIEQPFQKQLRQERKRQENYEPEGILETLGQIYVDFECKSLSRKKAEAAIGKHCINIKIKSRLLLPLTYSNTQSEFQIFQSLFNNREDEPTRITKCAECFAPLDQTLRDSIQTDFKYDATQSTKSTKVFISYHKQNSNEHETEGLSTIQQKVGLDPSVQKKIDEEKEDIKSVLKKFKQIKTSFRQVLTIISEVEEGRLIEMVKDQKQKIDEQLKQTKHRTAAGATDDDRKKQTQVAMSSKTLEDERNYVILKDFQQHHSEIVDYLKKVDLQYHEVVKNPDPNFAWLFKKTQIKNKQSGDQAEGGTSLEKQQKNERAKRIRLKSQKRLTGELIDQIGIEYEQVEEHLRISEIQKKTLELLRQQQALIEEKRVGIQKTFGVIRANTNDGRSSEFLDPNFQLCNKTGEQKTILSGNLNKNDKGWQKSYKQNAQDSEEDNKAVKLLDRKAKKNELLKAAKHQPKKVKGQEKSLVKNYLNEFVKSRIYRTLPDSLKVLDGSNGTLGKFISRPYANLVKEGIIETNQQLYDAKLQMGLSSRVKSMCTLRFGQSPDDDGFHISMLYKKGKGYGFSKRQSEDKEAVLLFFNIPKVKVVELRETLLQGQHKDGTAVECIRKSSICFDEKSEIWFNRFKIDKLLNELTSVVYVLDPNEQGKQNI